MLITFEGGEGSGKTSQIGALKEHIETVSGKAVILTREPGGTHIGDHIRKILLADEHKNLCHKSELLLFLAARAQIVEEIIYPALQANKVVICDRFIHSTIVYQFMVRQVVGKEFLSQLLGYVCSHGQQLIYPDITFLLDIPAEVGLKRSLRRLNADGVNEGRFEQEDIVFHNNVNNAYRMLAGTGEMNIQLINANKSKDEVSYEIRTVYDNIISGE